MGATTVSFRTTPRSKSSRAKVRAKVVLPAPGVATAIKSRGFVSKYFFIASACQARRLTEVPQGARSGYAGESFGLTILSNNVGSSYSLMLFSPYFLWFTFDSVFPVYKGSYRNTDYKFYHRVVIRPRGFAQLFCPTRSLFEPKNRVCACAPMMGMQAHTLQIPERNFGYLSPLSELSLPGLRPS